MRDEILIAIARRRFPIAAGAALLAAQYALGHRPFVVAGVPALTLTAAAGGAAAYLLSAGFDLLRGAVVPERVQSLVDKVLKGLACALCAAFIVAGVEKRKTLADEAVLSSAPAIERLKSETGRYPASLDDLSASTAAPHDICSGMPLFYKRADDGGSFELTCIFSYPWRVSYRSLDKKLHYWE